MLPDLNRQHPCPGRFFATRKGSGQNLNEYGLVIGLVLLGTLLALSTMGSNLFEGYNTILSAWRNGTPQTTANTPSLIATGSESSPEAAHWQSTRSPGSMYGTRVEVSLPSGRTLRMTLPDTNNLLDTTGPNGVTEAYLGQIEQLTAVLTDELGPDAPIIAQLKTLAEEGHAIADSQRPQEATTRKIRELIQNNPTPDAEATARLNQLLNDFAAQAPDFRCRGEATPAAYNACSAKFIQAPFAHDTMYDKKFTKDMALALHALKSKAELRPLLPLVTYLGNQVQGSVHMSKRDAAALWPFYSSLSQKRISTRTFVEKISSQTRSPLTEASANGICSTSRAVTCYQRNGQTSSQREADIAKAHD